MRNRCSGVLSLLGTFVLFVLASIACGGSDDAPANGANGTDGGDTTNDGGPGPNDGDGGAPPGDASGVDGDATTPPGPPLPTNLSAALNAAYVCSLAKKNIVCWGNYQASPEQIGAGSDWALVAPGGSPTSGKGIGCALKTDGTLWCWTEKVKTPVQLEQGTFKHMSSNGSVTCAVDTTGKLFCRGTNNYGQLGVGDTNARAVLTQVGTETDWARVQVGSLATCALKASGALHCWGDNTGSQIAPTATNPITSPLAIAAGSTFTDLAVGGGAACAIQSDGRLLCWGNGNVPGVSSTSPTAVDGATDWVEVRLGLNHLCARKTTGALHCMGGNGRGQIGNDLLTNVTTMTRVGTASDWFDVATSGFTTCGAHVDGTIDCWGDGIGGQLGRAPVTPTLIGNAGEWKDVVARRDLTCGVKTNGEVFCWGTAGYTGFPLGPDLAYAVPQKLGMGTWAGVAIGGSDVFVWPSAGALSSMGKNDSGMDGVNSLTRITTLTSTGFAAAQVTVGSFHACGLTAAGALSCWGRASDGQLGFASAPNVLVPTASGSATYKTISAARASTCGIRTDGTLWCWGSSWGSAPVQVSSETTWTYLSAVAFDEVFYGIANGGLRSWKAGETGPGTDNSGVTWKSYDGDSYYSMALGLHTCGIRTDGTLWCGGWNSAGEVGDGTTTQRNGQVQIGIATDWTKAVTGTSHTCGLRGTSLYCWGANNNGQVGDGTGFAKVPRRLQ